ncbi:MAG: peptidase [Acidobacteriota bacterium]|nr:peptidase [Acidobacteriota bacterium]
MKLRHMIFILLFLSACLPKDIAREHVKPEANTPALHYIVDVSDRSEDLFSVTLRVDDLSEENAILQFAKTAPGTYQTMNIGLFVNEIGAYDDTGNQLPVEKLSTNQWELTQPEDTAEIRYTIYETWDQTPEGSKFIYPMAGTSIEEDHVQICPHAVLGFPVGMQERPLRLELEYPENWTVGTALEGEDGVWHADNYDHAVDSPLLLGELSYASTEIGGMLVDVFTYSKTGIAQSDEILNSIQTLLPAVHDFLEEMPAPRYTFLFHFEDFSMGAWEHNLSSNYVYSEKDYRKELNGSLLAVASHEILHIVTPLNIHSERITPFNFADPIPSKHLWLYEGTTEWAAQILRLRGGILSLEAYLQMMTEKLTMDSYFDKSFSLVDMAERSYEPEGARQFANIYMRGAMTAGLLDIRLLELSDGKAGLRELLLRLLARYGRDKTFPEDRFFDILVEMTHPEIADFFDRYVKDNQPLPVAEMFGKLGITYTPEVTDEEEQSVLGYQLVPSAEGKLLIGRPEIELKEMGLKNGDALIGIQGRELGLDFSEASLKPLMDLPTGADYTIRVKRGEEEKDLNLKKLGRKVTRYHILTPDPQATPEQLAFRKIWMTNL